MSLQAMLPPHIHTNNSEAVCCCGRAKELQLQTHTAHVWEPAEKWIAVALARTGFAAVMLATHKASGEKWACKIMSLPAKDALLGEDEVSR